MYKGQGPRTHVSHRLPAETAGEATIHVPLAGCGRPLAERAPLSLWVSIWAAVSLQLGHWHSGLPGSAHCLSRLVSVRAGGPQREEGAQNILLLLADPEVLFSWSEEDISDLYSHTTVLLAAEGKDTQRDPCPSTEFSVF